LTATTIGAVLAGTTSVTARAAFRDDIRFQTKLRSLEAKLGLERLSQQLANGFRP
jgi:hypothetical protein